MLVFAVVDERIEELEALLLRTEEEKSGYVTRLTQMQDRCNDLDIQLKSYESKLTHRASQVGDLQRDLHSNMNHVAQLEREVRKRTSQSASLERQLEDKVTEMAEVLATASEQEKNLKKKVDEVTTLKKKVEEKEEALTRSEAMLSKTESLHNEESQLLQNAIKQVRFLPFTRYSIKTCKTSALFNQLPYFFFSSSLN